MEDETLLRRMFGQPTRVGRRLIYRQVLPGATEALKACKNLPKRKINLSEHDKEQVWLQSSVTGATPAQIAAKLKFSKDSVEKALTESRDDASAPMRAQLEAVLAGTMYQKISLLLDSITPEAIQKALDGGKLKDVAQSVALLTDRRAALIEDLKERVGVDHMANATSVGELIERIKEGFAAVDRRITRDALKNAVEVQEEPDE